MARHAVFVYGTLKRGERHHHLLASARFVGRGRTAPRFGLVDMGGYPAMVEGGRTAVEGEIWEVDDRTLEKLDALEEHPRFYRRIRLELSDGGVTQTYVLPPTHARGAPDIPSGRWSGTSDGA